MNAHGIYISHDALLVNEARDLLTEALFCLVQPTRENRAAALVLAGIAILKLADSDPSAEAQERALRLCREVVKR